MSTYGLPFIRVFVVLTSTIRQRVSPVSVGVQCDHFVVFFSQTAVPSSPAEADSSPRATRWARQRGRGVGVKRQEAPRTLVITQVSQQCAALSPLKEADMKTKSK